VKLLFDQNLSPKLVMRLAELYPDSDHVRNLGLKEADDRTVWEYAAHEQYTLVTKDEDFHARSNLQSHPPKVLWIRSGNCSTDFVETLLRKNFAEIETFGVSPQAGFLALY
jgi:predicted nuclease of predicted toxin-antitoxin system